jgi:hypothetical protein
MAEESREELVRKALLANALSAQSKAIDTDVDIAPPVPTDEVVAPVEDTSTIRSDMAREGMELVGTKVDIPDEVPLYSKDGVQVPIPKPVQVCSRRFSKSRDFCWRSWRGRNWLCCWFNC